MDMRQYGTGFVKPDDVRDGPRGDRIKGIHEDLKYNHAVLELESGDQFSVNATNNRILIKAWGWESEDWLGQEIEFGLGHYKDWEANPPQEKETVVVRPVSAPKNTVSAPKRTATNPKPIAGEVSGLAGNGGAIALPSQRDHLDDEIPF